MIRKLNLKHVKIIGNVPREEMPVFAENHDIYIQTNKIDNMPRSVIEMWAAGLPVVATNVGGVPHLITNHEDGILIESDNHQEMADTCLSLFLKPDFVEKLSINGKKRSEEFSWGNIGSIWEKVLRL